jgi:CelD/BcsL family acetyltransferase involved in cellulose biosynthesis
MVMELEAIPRTARTRIRDAWTELEARARPSYFLSWGWVETWLDAVPPSVPLVLHVARQAGAPVAAFFLGACTQWRHRVLPSRTLHLNQTGVPEYDDIFIEYNALLAPADNDPPPLAEVLARLPSHWDELYLAGLDAAAAPARQLVDLGGRLRVRIEREVPAPLVELDKVRAAKGDYVGLLGKNTRAAIRRSIRLYEERGKLALEVADSLPRALAVFDELVALHRRAWQDRGQDGAFQPFVRAFHERLIRARFAAGEIQLVRVRAGDATVGCLYNFVFGGTIWFYQSGFAYEAEAKLKPGMVCHAEAVRHNAAYGHRDYDFLGGATAYKESLSTASRRLVWARIQKPRLRFVAEDLARRARDRARAYRAARAG